MRHHATTRFLQSLFLLAIALGAGADARALGRAPQLLIDQPGTGVVLLSRGVAATIYTDAGEHAGVVRAAANLRADLDRVGASGALLNPAGARTGSDLILVGTLGKSKLIDDLVAAGKLDVDAIRGKWEGYVIAAVAQPLPGVARALVIAGADKRGSIFGVYDLSEQLGVSPWYWWADVPPTRRSSVIMPMAARIVDAPVVRYRGIFLNDEQPALSNWSQQRFGGYNSAFYERVFELILRMRGNYLWPAMWNSAFFDDDKENGRLADEMGIIMGTSHHEPMMRAQQEWKRYGGKGAWDYTANGARLREFWRGGIRATRDYEKVVTIGMRGDGDEPMSQAANVALLENIVADQRGILQQELGKSAGAVPQVWALYKEVQDYYERGMRVPDDVTLLWCDDNWGNIRRLPTPAERARAGGAGVYYHFDYVGGPRSYKWINVTPIPKIWEQMHLAWRLHADRMWIVNVGDLKPMEVPTEFFLSYAWNPAAWSAERLPQYLRLWAAREFGAVHAGEIADIVNKYTQYNGRRKPEQLAPGTYSLSNYAEAQRVVADYDSLAARALAINVALPPEQRDAFFQLVLYPVRAAATLNALYVATAQNRLYAAQGRPAANDMAARARALFALDAELTRQYHEDISGGKWNHMMSQPHIGATSWQAPERNIMPELKQVEPVAGAAMGIAVEGAEQAWPALAAPALPALDGIARQARTIDIFNRGTTPFTVTLRASEPWVKLSHVRATVERELRVTVDVDWAAAPLGTSMAALTVRAADGAEASIAVPVNKPSVGAGDARAHVETQGVVAIEAEHYGKAVAAAGRSWLTIPDHGRTLSGVTTLPVDAAALDLAQGMRLEYPVQLVSAGKVKVQLTLAPTLKFQPGAGLRYAVSIDDEAPQVVNVHADASERFWARAVSDGAVTFTTTHAIARPGQHVLRYWPIDAGLVLQKLVIDAGGLKPSYLGPPESPRLGDARR
jgi:hypothetical protein